VTAPGHVRRRAGLSIGAVLAQLRPEFPDVTISKIRFLESAGLLSPARSESGYRQFRPADVARLRFVLSAQRDRYLPLKVIREQLAAGAAPVEPTTGPVADPVSGVGPVEPALTAPELLRRAGIDTAMLAELEQYGLIRPSVDGRYEADSVRLAATVRALAEHGIEPRQLRAFRAAADREVGLLRQAVAAREDTPSELSELGGLALTLHTLLVKAGLRTALG
jgi:DNA-binding transcriptional MerR regulator